MADFLTRLAGRTLGLAPTVQPVLAPMYAPGQQFVGAGETQQGIQDTRSAINLVPTEDVQGGIRGQEMSLRDGIANEPVSGELVGQSVHWQEIPPPLVPQGNEPSLMQNRRETPGMQAAPGQPASLERVEAESSPSQVPVLHPASFEDRIATSERPLVRNVPAVTDALSLEWNRSSDPQPRRAGDVWESVGRNNGQTTTGTPTPARNGGRPQGVAHPGDDEVPRPGNDEGPLHPAPPAILRVPQGYQPVEVPLLPLVVDDLSTRRLGEPKVIRPQQDSSQAGRLAHPYKRVDQPEVAPATQESSAQVPTIQVTIGRIEVRATPPPASRRQPRRSEPAVVGLEEYLNQRAKGGY